MGNFVLYSIIGSVVLTLLLNLLPMLFPNFAANTMRKLEQSARQTIDQHEDNNRPRVKVFFPWKAMLIGSVILTILVNLVRMFAG
ncbi:hypothetical protein [Mariniblastus fucicola]|uniref:Uncharacterized protein n=1 Tax=Mariniblastus fucicola TaxID=980251 RepID=A0A5B9P908_9BACT|nr:hypothetical protein [Mariniblastus fucicola]QEG21715.1 hypothetical protein MFFC18_15740 [Mariniblastus fucicola]